VILKIVNKKGEVMFLNRIILVSMLSFVELNALRLDRVIVSTDMNPTYVQFWPIVAKVWKEVVGLPCTLVVIGCPDESIDTSLGDVIFFEPIEGIPTSLQAQVIRLFAPCLDQYQDQVCLISDVDMIPLCRWYFKKSVKNIPEDCFVVYRDGCDKGERYPMCYNAAKGSVFREIFNIRTLDDIRELIIEWAALDLKWNTDEIMLTKILKEWNKASQRCFCLGHNTVGRVDRLDWQYSKTLVKKHHYIDAHMVRPYLQYQQAIDDLVACLGVEL
jgi:hypothetical protein